MTEEELLKHMTITYDIVIFDKNFYENTIMSCIDNSIKIKHILIEFEKWLEEEIKQHQNSRKIKNLEKL